MSLVGSTQNGVAGAQTEAVQNGKERGLEDGDAGANDTGVQLDQRPAVAGTCSKVGVAAEGLGREDGKAEDGAEYYAE